MDMQESKTSKDFKVVVTLPAWKARMIKQELDKHEVPAKITAHGTNISWDEIRGGGMSPDIFMHPFPRDVYVPQNQFKKAKDILARLGIEGNELDMPCIRMWQRVWAVLALTATIIVIIISFLVFLDS